MRGEGQIAGSVGIGGRNQPRDVRIVQELLKSSGTLLGPVDGICGAQTVTAIRNFQHRFVGPHAGLIAPGSPSFARLSAASEFQVAPAAAAVRGDWSGDAARWTQEKKLKSMHPDLAGKVGPLLAALARRGFQPKVCYGWRSVAVQARLLAEGKSKVRFSFHNAQTPDGTPRSCAADIVDARFGWSKDAETSGSWRALGEEAKRRGLIWGGDWATFRDWAHVQLLPSSRLKEVKRESGA